MNPGTAARVVVEPRGGLREWGVPEGGAFDRSSARLANALVGNPPGRSAIELTLFGGRFRAEATLALAIAGAPFDARTSRGRRIAVPGSFTLEAGEEIVLGGTGRGLRVYLAVRGGWDRQVDDPLTKGDRVGATPERIAGRRPVAIDLPDPSAGPIRLVDGTDGPVPEALLAGPYRVGQGSDRVGLRLGGPAIVGAERPGRASAPTAPGAVQVAGGEVLILGPDGGTIGGYPHVAHVIAADLDRLGQARPGETIRFARVDLDEARRLDRKRRRDLDARDRRIALACGRSGDE